MKSIRNIFILSLFIILFSGCDKFKEKRFSTTIPYDFSVQINDDQATSILLTGDLTSMINDDLEKVKDKIKRYELVSITYKIWEYNGLNPNTFTGTIGFGNANAASAGVEYTYPGIDLQAGNDNPNQVAMNLNGMDISRIQQYFLDTNGLRLFLSGSVDNKPVFFKLQVIVNIDAVAEVEK